MAQKEDLKYTKRLVDFLSKEFPNLELKQTTEICSISKWVVAFNHFVLETPDIKLKVGDSKPKTLIIAIHSDINKAGCGDGLKPAIARTFVFVLEVRGLKRFTQRRTEETTLFNIYCYDRAINSLIYKVRTRLKDFDTFIANNNISNKQRI